MLRIHVFKIARHLKIFKYLKINKFYLLIYIKSIISNVIMCNKLCCNKFLVDLIFISYKKQKKNLFCILVFF
jgi:hypothetical protein